jgi:hypothetical protein
MLRFLHKQIKWGRFDEAQEVHQMFYKEESFLRLGFRSSRNAPVGYGAGNALEFNTSSKTGDLLLRGV